MGKLYEPKIYKRRNMNTNKCAPRFVFTKRRKRCTMSLCLNLPCAPLETHKNDNTKITSERHGCDKKINYSMDQK